MNSIRERYLKILDRVDHVCQRSGRNLQDVKIVVVSKRQPVEKIIEAVKAGVRILGENYPEETISKIEELPVRFTPEWHMIGHIQSRKVKNVADAFSVVHSIDSLKIAEKLNLQCISLNIVMPIMIEVNVSEEESKCGFRVNNHYDYEKFYKVVEEIKKLKSLFLTGLMTMPPYVTRAEENRKYFMMCRELQERISNELDLNNFIELSMGTSMDFEIAIEEGATYIRIGEAIMGDRKIRI